MNKTKKKTHKCTTRCKNAIHHFFTTKNELVWIRIYHGQLANLWITPDAGDNVYPPWYPEPKKRK